MMGVTAWDRTGVSWHGVVPFCLSTPSKQTDEDQSTV